MKKEDASSTLATDYVAKSGLVVANKTLDQILFLRCKNQAVKSIFVKLNGVNILHINLSPLLGSKGESLKGRPAHVKLFLCNTNAVCRFVIVVHPLPDMRVVPLEAHPIDHNSPCCLEKGRSAPRLLNEVPSKGQVVGTQPGFGKFSAPLLQFRLNLVRHWTDSQVTNLFGSRKGRNTGPLLAPEESFSVAPDTVVLDLKVVAEEAPDYPTGYHLASDYLIINASSCRIHLHAGGKQVLQIGKGHDSILLKPGHLGDVLFLDLIQLVQKV
mmetsp:Transcript_22652/g.35448  ORF Transcript_22652/g.35448 Transcript_22652/m.35448 type:complete len:270 (-) Transcript_22652:801-1610(-)